MTAQEQLDLAFKAGEGSTDVLRNGVYKVLFGWFLTPGRFARLVKMMWKLNYDSGWVENVELGPKGHKGIVHQWASHHPFLCKLNVAVKVAIYRSMGCENVQIEERYCVSDGDDACGSIIVWE